MAKLRKNKVKKPIFATNAMPKSIFFGYIPYMFDMNSDFLLVASLLVTLVLCIKLLRTSKGNAVSQRTAIISMLSADYDLVCYINAKKNKVYFNIMSEAIAEIENDIDKSLPSNKRFDVLLRNLIHPDDFPQFIRDVNREKVTEALTTKPSYTIHARVQLHKEPQIYAIKFVKDSHKSCGFVVGFRNIDDEMRKDEENRRLRKDLRATELLANKDALTGVNNTTAFNAKVKDLDVRREAGQRMDFAFVECDVNNLKTTNDTQGHEAGNKLIKKCCMVFCELFKHSPVYRVGGDEFVILLQNHDFDNREILMRQLMEAGAKEDFAAGIAVFDAEVDPNALSVLKRADASMYQNKKKMKS